MNSGIFSVENDWAKGNANILPKDAQGTDLSLNSYQAYMFDLGASF